MTDQIVGQRVEIKKFHDSEAMTGRVCGWFLFNNARAFAVVELDDGTFELAEISDLYLEAPGAT